MTQLCTGTMPILEHCSAFSALPSPRALRSSCPLSPSARQLISHSRQTIRKILDGGDCRLLVIVGPCSIHDPAAALEYARRLKELAGEVSETLFLAMRVYVEKPRTATGWKGLVNDPVLDGTCRIATGLTVSRQLLTAIAELGLPAATEAVA